MRFQIQSSHFVFFDDSTCLKFGFPRFKYLFVVDYNKRDDRDYLAMVIVNGEECYFWKDIVL